MSQHRLASVSAAAKVQPALQPAYQAMEDASNEGYPYARSAYFEQLLAANRHSDKVTDAIAPYLEPRHPSQLYEGALEGLLLFVILWTVRVRFPKAPDGLLTGLFFLLYPIFRIFAEQFREPDAKLMGPFTQGQFLSFFMFFFSACFLTYAWRGWRKSVRA